MIGGALIAVALLGVVNLLGVQRFETASPLPAASFRAIDGDTIENVATRERIRLADVDTPETRGRAQCASERRAGEAATRATRALLAQARRIQIRDVGRIDRYGRTIAYVILDGRELGRTLIETGHARPWRGRGESWC